MKLKELVDDAILDMASYHKPSTGELLINCQSDWYPIFRMLNDWNIYDSKSQTAFCQYLEKRYENLDKEGDKELAPCCKRKDLTQAAAGMFDENETQAWSRLHPKTWKISFGKFNHYCDIVDAFNKLMREQAFQKYLNLEDLLPSKEDLEEEDSEKELDSEEDEA